MTRRTFAGIGALIVGLVLVTALLVVRSFVYIPFLGDDTPVIHDAASLPDSLHLCGRSWTKGVVGVQQTLETITSQIGSAPVFVNPAVFAACPEGACTTAAGGQCATVIFARVGDDGYVVYSLRGGP
jgi:hypothetical protein